MAISAALTRRACWNSRSSFQSACACLNMSQTALCSRANRLWRRLSPSHRLSRLPVSSVPGGLVVEQAPVVLHLDLAVGAGAENLLLGLGAAVDVRAVPPVRVLVDVGRRVVGVRHLRRIDRRLRHVHRPLEPGIAVGERQIVRVVEGALGVHEPVVHLELDPGRRQHVEDRGRLERLAREERVADVARIGVEQVGGVGERFGERHVAAEPCAGRAHHRALQIVEGAVHGAAGLLLLGGGARLLGELRLFGVDAGSSRAARREPRSGSSSRQGVEARTTVCRGVIGHSPLGSGRSWTLKRRPQAASAGRTGTTHGPAEVAQRLPASGRPGHARRAHDGEPDGDERDGTPCEQRDETDDRDEPRTD